MSNEIKPTCRSTVPAIEPLVGLEFKVLDHGFVRLVDYMGDDSAIVQAARVSYGAGTKKVSEDRGLIRYLLRHAHTTPFEMCEIKFHCKMPIFVARQWIRHRTANVNEYSARYSEMPGEFYCPDLEHITGQDQKNKQSRGTDLERNVQVNAHSIIQKANRDGNEAYQQLLKFGVARELSREVLPVSNYTEWYWKIDLHNLFHFLRLRLHEHAQYEIRVFGEAMAKIVKQWVPMAWEAFEDYRLNAMNLSGPEVAYLKDLLDQWVHTRPLKEDFTKHGLTGREIKELNEKLELNMQED